MNNKLKLEYKLDIGAKILKLLGPNLYTNIYYIIAELIANSYDADARNVYIITKSNSIIIEDDGNGMSYDDTKIYLKVAEETRKNREDSYTKKKRRKIGRKGIGKLAALSISEDVWVQTMKNKRKLGFILTVNISSDNILEPLKEKDIKFEKITNHGTSIIMKNPRKNMSKNLEIIEKNLVKILPIINKNFRIHIIQDDKEMIIDSFNKVIISELGGLITIGEEFEYLKDYFDDVYQKKDKKLLDIRKRVIKVIELENNFGNKKEYDLIMKGWVGVYKTTRGRSGNFHDFPDNFISLISNGKLGACPKIIN